jgi:large subunit ribosomal protein L19
MNIIEELERAQAAKLATQREIPEFQPGDTVIVNVKVKEGERTRVQAYEGVCIARNGGGLNESFTVRKISYGEGVERVFPLYAPMIDSIKVVRRGKVRRAKLYYLRDRRGKSARIAEKMESQKAAEAAPLVQAEPAETPPKAAKAAKEPTEAKSAEAESTAAKPAKSPKTSKADAAPAKKEAVKKEAKAAKVPEKKEAKAKK